MQNNNDDNLRNSFISGSGRRFVSDTRESFHYTSFETKNLLKAYSPEIRSPLLYKKGSFVELEPHVVLTKDKLELGFNIISGDTGYKYVLKDILALLSAIHNGDTISYGKHLEFTHDLSAFTEKSRKIIRFLISYFRERQLKDNLIPSGAASTISYTYAKGRGKQIELFGHEIDELFF